MVIFILEQRKTYPELKANHWTLNIAWQGLPLSDFAERKEKRIMYQQHGVGE